MNIYYDIRSALYFNQGKVVGEVSPKFREKVPGARALRENTIGWMLDEYTS